MTTTGNVNAQVADFSSLNVGGDLNVSSLNLTKSGTVAGDVNGTSITMNLWNEEEFIVNGKIKCQNLTISTASTAIAIAIGNHVTTIGGIETDSLSFGNTGSSGVSIKGDIKAQTISLDGSSITSPDGYLVVSFDGNIVADEFNYTFGRGGSSQIIEPATYNNNSYDFKVMNIIGDGEAAYGRLVLHGSLKAQTVNTDKAVFWFRDAKIDNLNLVNESRLSVEKLVSNNVSINNSGLEGIVGYSTNFGTLGVFSVNNITIVLGNYNINVPALILLGEQVDPESLGKLTIKGGEIGSRYCVLQTESVIAKEVEKKIIDKIAMSGTLYSYDVDIEDCLEPASPLFRRYFATVKGANGQYIQQAAISSSSANGGIANAIINIINHGILNHEMQSIFSILNEMTTPHALGRAITELNGHNAASAHTQMGRSAVQQFNAAVGTAFADAHAARMFGGHGGHRAGHSAGRFGRASAGGVPVTYGETAAACEPRWNGWTKVFGGFGGVDGDAGGSGYDFGNVGVMVGLDREIGAELSLGALLGYSFSKSELNENLGEATDNLLRLGGYASYNWNNFFFNTSPTFGIHMLESDRKINFMGKVAESERTGFDFNLFNQVGYTFTFGNGWMVTPSYALGMTYMHDPDYSEHGAGGANLYVEDTNQWSLLQNLELKIGKSITLGGRMILLPEIWGGWEHEYLQSGDVSMGFAGVSGNRWSAPVSDIAANRAVFGAGIKTLWAERYEAYARYDQKLWDGGYNTNFAVGFGVKF